MMANEIVGDNIKAEKGAFTFSHGKGEEIRNAPFVYCPNLISKVSDMVRHHERQAVGMCACVYVVGKGWRNKYQVHIDTNNIVDTVVLHGIMEPFQMMSCGSNLEEIKAMEALSSMFNS